MAGDARRPRRPPAAKPESSATACRGLAGNAAPRGRAPHITVIGDAPFHAETSSRFATRNAGRAGRLTAACRSCSTPAAAGVPRKLINRWRMLDGLRRIAGRADVVAAVAFGGLAQRRRIAPWATLSGWSAFVAFSPPEPLMGSARLWRGAEPRRASPGSTSHQPGGRRSLRSRRIGMAPLAAGAADTARVERALRRRSAAHSHRLFVSNGGACSKSDGGGGSAGRGDDDQRSRLRAAHKHCWRTPLACRLCSGSRLPVRAWRRIGRQSASLLCLRSGLWRRSGPAGERRRVAPRSGDARAPTSFYSARHRHATRWLLFGALRRP